MFDNYTTDPQQGKEIKLSFYKSPRSNRYKGVTNDCNALNALADVPAVESPFVHTAAELQKYLGQ